MLFDPGSRLGGNVEGFTKQHGEAINGVAARFQGRGELLGGGTRIEGIRAYRKASKIRDLTEEFEGQGLQFIGVEMPPKPPKSR